MPDRTFNPVAWAEEECEAVRRDILLMEQQLITADEGDRAQADIIREAIAEARTTLARLENHLALMRKHWS